MASDEIIIKNIAKPTIRLDELAVPNRTGHDSLSGQLAQDSDEKSFGAYVPVVFVNGYYVHKYLINFELDMTTFLPVVRLRFRMSDPLFISVSYPKDGDILSIYFRSFIEVYKPIRMDFNILSVESSQSIDSEGTGSVFSILGETRIPGLYSEISKAFRNNTSHDTLFNVSQDLNLGFSSNDSNLTDSMTWICPNLSYYDFIRDVSERSYKDDRSFFQVWIDPYYNLTFVNLENQLSANDYMQNVKVIRGQGDGSANDTTFDNTENLVQEMPLIFTNQKGSSDLPFYIKNYTLISRAGNVTNNKGYVQEIQFYDDTMDTLNHIEKYNKYTIETTTREAIPDNMVLQKGRIKEDIYKNDIRKTWVGSLNSEVHENFLHAKIQNDFNLDDLSKFTLRIETGGFYSGIYRGQAVPVMIYVNEQGLRKDNVGASENQKTEDAVNPVVDRFLSGIYILMGIKLKYSPVAGIYQVLYLRKRDWILNSAGEFPKAFPLNLVSG